MNRCAKTARKRWVPKMSAHIEELHRLVRSAEQDLRAAELAFQEHARGLHLSKTILAERLERLETALRVEAAESQ